MVQMTIPFQFLKEKKSVQGKGGARHAQGTGSGITDTYPPGRTESGLGTEIADGEARGCGPGLPET